MRHLFLTLVYVAPWVIFPSFALANADIDAVASTYDAAGFDMEFESNVKDFRVHLTDEVTGFAETINVTEKSKGVTDLSEVLANSVGIQVRSMGGLGSYGAASIRGATPNQVPVFLDNIQLNTGGSSTVNLGDFSLDVLDAIEVYRGNAPLRLGTGGIGGAIVLRTRLLKEPILEVAGSYGSWNTWDVYALWGRTAGKLDVLAIASVQYTDGDFRYFNQQGTFFNDEDDRFETRTNNDHITESVLLKLARDVGKWRVTALDYFFNKDQGLAGIDSYAGFSDARMKTLRNSANVRFDRPVGDKSTVDLDLSYLLLWELFDDRDGNIGIGHQDHKYRTDAIGGAALISTALSPQHDTVFRLASRFERYNEFRRGEPKTDQQSPSYRVKTEMGAEYDWHPWSSLHMVPTVRSELHYSYFGGGKINNYDADCDATDKTDFYFSPSLGMRYEPVKGLTFRANGGRYVRTPDLTELFGDRGAVVGNPDLVAETGYNVDAGMTYLYSGTSFLNFLRVDIAGFGSRVKDQISLVQNSQSTSRPVNLDKASIIGAEFQARGTFFNWLTLAGNYTLFHGINKSNIPRYYGKRLPVRPVHEVYGRVELKKEVGSLALKGWGDASYAGKAYLQQDNREECVSKHYFVGIGGRIGHLKSGFTFSFEVKNLLNKLRFKNEDGDWRAMSDYGRYPLPGRTFMATLHWQLPK